MQTMLQNNSRAEGHLSNTALMRGITAGLIGGLVGTIVMDLFEGAVHH